MAGSMQRLSTAFRFQGDGEEISQVTTVNYKSGAKFEGKIVDHKRIGTGIFIWPSGSKYKGDYSNNLRNGKGTQVWNDESSYTGEFLNDLRHGEGSIHWANGETYEGTFFKDRRHGKGTYRWPDGSSYTGTFYMDKKEGYGTFGFANGNIFQGLYKDDEREGPGVMTYVSGTQDVGLWRGEKLIKLCSEIKGAFTLKSHPELDYKPENHEMYIETVDDKQSQLAPIANVLFPPSVLDYLPKSDLSQRIHELYSDALDSRSLALDRQTFDTEFFKDISWDPVCLSRVAAWNATSDMIALQKHTFKHAGCQNNVQISIDAVIKMDRSIFKEKGPLELLSEEFITAAGKGDVNKIEHLLSSGKVHPDVADCHGYTALIGAVVNWHIVIINLLLNHGANVNRLTDEGCSALAAGTVFFYPVEGFIRNIAENYTKPPSEYIVADTKQDTCPLDLTISDTKQGTCSFNLTVSDTKRNTCPLNLTVSDTKQDTCPLDLTISDVEQDIHLLDLTGSDTKHEAQLKSILVNNREHSEVNNEKSSKCLSLIGPKTVTFAEENEELEISRICTTDQSDSEENNDRTIIKMSESETDIPSLSEDDYEKIAEECDESEDEENPEEFESIQSVRNYPIQVTEQLLERCATQLSRNELVVSKMASEVNEMEKVRRLARRLALQGRMKETLNLLLRRGADPNASSVPMPVLFFAIKSADVDMVRQLLMKGANPNSKLSKEKDGLYPLHIACAIPGEKGLEMTELLLNALADPDARAKEDDSFLNHFLEEEWSKDPLSKEAKSLLGGRTALQIACAREDNYKNASQVIRLLLEHKANANLTCNGFSPLALAIASGNDLAIDELLQFGANPSLPLSHGVGSALCAAMNTQYEHHRTLQGRLELMDKLIKAGANVLSPIPIGPKRIMGTAVDYAYHMFNQDSRIAHIPYHALTQAERETYNARRKLFTYVGNIMRVKAVEREKVRNEENKGLESQSPSSNFVYIGAGAKLPPGFQVKSAGKSGQGQVKPALVMTLQSPRVSSATRKPLFKYCYECGRSIGVRLTVCTRCKEVFYCSKACKLKAWNARHKDECIRIGSSRNSSPKLRAPTSTTVTIANKGSNQRIIGPSKSAEGERKMSNHKFRTGSPPNYAYVYVDNYSHN